MKILKNWLSYLAKKLTRLFTYTGSEMAFAFPKSGQLTTCKKQSNLYHHCSDLPLDIFIDCIVDNEYNRLIKSGTVKEETLLSVWENIFIEYCELSGTTHFKKTLSLLREIGSLKSKLMAIDTCILILANKYSYFAITVLKKYGYDYAFPKDKKFEFVEDLQKVSNNKKSIELTIMQKEKEYKLMIDNVKGNTIDRLYFDKQLITLSKWIGFPLRKQEITVTEYVTHLNMMIEEIKNKQTDGK